MTAAYCTNATPAVLFSDADLQYQMMKEQLTSREFQSETEADVERWLSEQQRELMRLMHQAFLTLRGQAQALRRPPVSLGDLLTGLGKSAPQFAQEARELFALR